MKRGENDLKYLNELLVCFVQWAYNQKFNVHAAKHGILACQVRWPHTKGNLKAAWESLRSWTLELPVGHRTPLTSLSLHALCFTSLMLSASSSSRADADSWLRLSILLRVGFHGLLRPKELFSLLRADIFLPPLTHGSADCIVMSIRDPKNRFHLGRVQHAVLHDASSCAWLRWLCDSLPSGSRLWRHSLAKARSMFKVLVRMRGLEIANFTLASLRAGGATHAYLHGCEISRLKFMGRWLSDKSLQCYIQEAAARLALTQLLDPSCGGFVLGSKPTGHGPSCAPGTPRMLVQLDVLIRWARALPVQSGALAKGRLALRT